MLSQHKAFLRAQVTAESSLFITMSNCNNDRDIDRGTETVEKQKVEEETHGAPGSKALMGQRTHGASCLYSQATPQQNNVNENTKL